MGEEDKADARVTRAGDTHEEVARPSPAYGTSAAGENESGTAESLDISAEVISGDDEA